MKLPKLNQTSRKRESYIISFLGYNASKTGKDGEMRQMKNLSADDYPYLSQRKPRTRLGIYQNPVNLFPKGRLCMVADAEQAGEKKTMFFYGNTAVMALAEGKKQLVSMGAEILIFPDKKYFHPMKFEAGEIDAYGDLEALYQAEIQAVTFEQDAIVCADAPFETLFRVGDAVEISGAKNPENNKIAVIRKVAAGRLSFYENTFTADESEAAKSIAQTAGEGEQIIHAQGAPSSPIAKVARASSQEEMPVRIARKIPDMDYICQAGNRIWGCSSANNEIYASALGDARNWYRYDGVATDAYAVSVGTDGAFTGCVAYVSHIAFFKEDCVHKIYGSRPANFQVTSSQLQGIAQGCADSAAIVNQVLYYKSRTGIMSYTGGVPVCISDCFGPEPYDYAAAHAYQDKYYLSQRKQGGEEWRLFVYDIRKKVWHIEDDTHIAAFATKDGCLYYIDAADGALWRIGQTDQDTGVYNDTDIIPELAAQIEWSATLCEMHENLAGKKGYSALYLRSELARGAYLRVEVRTDNGLFHTVYTVRGERDRVIQVPILPVRCDRFQIRLSGRGVCKIGSLIREFQYGSGAG